MSRLAYFLLGILVGWWVSELLRDEAQQPGARLAGTAAAAAQRLERIIDSRSDAPPETATPASPAAASGTSPSQKTSATTATPAPEPATPEAETDDLTQITGVGKVAAKALNDAGIHSLRQLARQKPSDLSEKLTPALAARAEREDWIGQAKELLKRS